MQDIERISYSCTLCRFSGRGKASLLSHARTLTHIRAEQLAEARRQAEGGDQPDIGDIFTVGESQDGEQAESSETGECQYDLPGHAVPASNLIKTNLFHLKLCS